MNLLSNIGKKYGYSKFEVGLATYIICALLISISLLVYNQSEVKHALTPNYTTKTTASGKVSKSAPKSDPAPKKYAIQTYTAHDFKVSMNFDPNSYAIINYSPDLPGPNGTVHANTANDEVDIIGNPLGVSNQLIIAIMKDSPDSDRLYSPTTDTMLGIVPAFNAVIMGHTYIVYGYSDASPGSGTIINIPSGQLWYQIRIENYTHGGAKELPISTTTEKAIMESIEIR
jgi:hypothetical protein